MKGTKLVSYNKTNICQICRRDNNITDKSILYPHNARREKDKDRKETGEWVCFKHWVRDHEKYDSNSLHNKIKSVRDRRTGNLNDHNKIFGDCCEELTCRWREIKNLNKENNNYMSPMDHSRDPELGIIQTKGARLTVNRAGILKYEKWSIAVTNEHNKGFDYLIFYCASKDGEIIERIYIFPWEEIMRRTSIGIYKNPSRGIQWYEKYRIVDNSIIKSVNDIWQNIRKEKKKGG